MLRTIEHAMVRSVKSPCRAVLAVCAVSLMSMSSLAAQTKTVDITIDNFSFEPSIRTIPVGTMVRWTNRDDIPHTIAEKGLAFKSKALDTGDTFEHRFDQAGEVDYFCTLHPHMMGRIVVVPGTG